MSFSPDTPVDVVKPSLGFRRGVYEERTRPAVALCVHTTGAGPWRRWDEGQFQTPFDAALAIYAGMMEPGPHFVLEGDERARLAQVCPEDQCAWAVGAKGGRIYRRASAIWLNDDTEWWLREFPHLESPRQLAGGRLWLPYALPQGWRAKMAALRSKGRWFAALAGGSVNANVVHVEVTPPERGPREPWSPQTWKRLAQLAHGAAERHSFRLRRETVISHSEAHPRARSARGAPWDPGTAQWSYERFAEAAGLPLWCPPPAAA